MNSGLGPHAPPALALLMVNRRGQVSRAQTPLGPGHLAMNSPEDSESGQRPGVGMETLGRAGTGEHQADRALRTHTLSPPSTRTSTRPTSSPSCAHTHAPAQTHLWAQPQPAFLLREYTHCVLLEPTPPSACVCTGMRTHTHLTPSLRVHTLASIPYPWLCTRAVYTHPWPPCVYTLICTPSTVSQVPTKCIHTPSP